MSRPRTDDLRAFFGRPRTDDLRAFFGPDGGVPRRGGGYLVRD